MSSGDKRAANLVIAGGHPRKSRKWPDVGTGQDADVGSFAAGTVFAEGRRRLMRSAAIAAFKPDSRETIRIDSALRERFEDR